MQSHALIAVLTALEQGLLLVDAGAGQVLAAIAREAGGLTDEEVAVFESARIKSPARTESFD